MTRLTITSEEYFKLLELKGKYGEKGLYGLLVKLDELATKAKGDLVERDVKDIQAKDEMAIKDIKAKVVFQL